MFKMSIESVYLAFQELLEDKGLLWLTAAKLCLLEKEYFVWKRNIWIYRSFYEWRKIKDDKDYKPSREVNSL